MSDHDQRILQGKPPPQPTLTVWRRTQNWLRLASSFVTVEVIRAAIAAATAIAVAYGLSAFRPSDPMKPLSESQLSTE